MEFWSGPERVRGIWRLPDEAGGPYAAIVQAPGWFGLKDAKAYERHQQLLTEAGFGVLAIDYRGFGDSGGGRGMMVPKDQLDDLLNAVTYLTTREDVDREAIGVYGGGGTGGGNALILAAVDSRIRVSVAQVPVADGRDWLHRMRTEYEWIEYLKELEEDRRQRVLTGKGRMVTIRGGLMVETPERRANGNKADVDAKMPPEVPLALAHDILMYRPLDYAPKVRVPLMVVAVENDATVPTDHPLSLYEAAQCPKKLLIQRGTAHYKAYKDYGHIVIPEIVDWFKQHLHPIGQVVRRSENLGS